MSRRSRSFRWIPRPTSFRWTRRHWPTPNRLSPGPLFDELLPQPATNKPAAAAAISMRMSKSPLGFHRYNA
jgi:hypothetical protein